MALKRKTKVTDAFSMASMTDIIFLLLIFFMITSTMVVPNAIKVTLPQSSQKNAAKPLTRITIDKALNYYVAFGNQRERQISFELITPFLQDTYAKEPDMFLVLYADESVPYREIVRILNIANDNHFKMLLATRPSPRQPSSLPPQPLPSQPSSPTLQPSSSPQPSQPLPSQPSSPRQPSQPLPE
jgi:biopolymer transport protein ExbD